jgi:hypothetical protein
VQTKRLTSPPLTDDDRLRLRRRLDEARCAANWARQAASDALSVAEGLGYPARAFAADAAIPLGLIGKEATEAARLLALVLGQEVAP